MRILYLTHDMPWRSAFIRTLSLAKGMAARGHEVWLSASREEPGPGRKTWPCCGVRIVEVGDRLPRRVRNGGLSPLDAFRRMRFARSRTWDVVHAMSHRPAVVSAGWTAARRSRALYCFDWMDGWGFEGIAAWRRGYERWMLGGLDELLERFQLRLADGVTAVNDALMQRAVRVLGPERVEILAPGANVDLIRPRPPAAYRKRFDLDGSDFVIVNAAQNPYDADLVMTTFNDVARECPRARLLWAGPVDPRLKSRAEALGIADRTRFPGLVPYLALGEVLACGDVMFLPYRDSAVNRQRSPSKLGDFRAAGGPVGSRTAPGLVARAAAQRAALLAEPTPQACARAILALAADPGLCAVMGRSARRFATSELDWAHRAERAEAFYLRLEKEKEEKKTYRKMSK